MTAWHDVRVSRTLAAAVIALILVPGVVCAASNAVELQKKARARMKSLDFEAALPLLEQLRDLPDLDSHLRSVVLVDLGITFVNLGRADDARKAFDEALAAKPDLVFPAGVPPKVRRVFDDTKEARELRLHPAVVAAAPDPAPPPVAPIEPPKVVVMLEPPPPPPPSERKVVVPLVLVAAGAAAIGAGVGTALAAQSAGRELSAGLHTSSEAQALLSRRSTLGLTSYVCYGVGGAMAVAGAALFVFSGSHSQVSALITPSGGTLRVSGEF